MKLDTKSLAASMGQSVGRSDVAALPIGPTFSVELTGHGSPDPIRKPRGGMTKSEFIELLRDMPEDIFVQPIPDAAFGSPGGPLLTVRAEVAPGLGAVIFVRESLLSAALSRMA